MPYCGGDEALAVGFSSMNGRRENWLSKRIMLREIFRILTLFDIIPLFFTLWLDWPRS